MTNAYLFSWWQFTHTHNLNKKFMISHFTILNFFPQFQSLSHVLTAVIHYESQRQVLISLFIYWPYTAWLQMVKPLCHYSGSSLRVKEFCGLNQWTSRINPMLPQPAAGQKQASSTACYSSLTAEHQNNKKTSITETALVTEFMNNACFLFSLQKLTPSAVNTIDNSCVLHTLQSC